MTPQGPFLRSAGFRGYAGAGFRGYAGTGLSGFGDVPTDWATPAQRDRLTFLGNQLHAMGLSLQQAQANYDLNTVATLRNLIAKLKAEQASIQAAILRQSNAGQAKAEAGGYATPVESFFASVKNTLAGAGVIAAVGLGVLAYVASRR